MSNPKIKFKRSSVHQKRPTLVHLDAGELGLNTFDGKLFTRQDTGGVGIATTITLVNPWNEHFGSGTIDYIGTVGIGTTDPQFTLDVEGDIRSTNTLKVGSDSVLIDGVNNTVTVGSATTIKDGGINVTGVVTATTFDGNLATTNLTGTITNDQLAGSINNSKLDNSSISFGGVILDLGQADPTPAFDLSDATNYPFENLSGITTEIVGDTTPQLGGDLDVNGNDITGAGNINLTGNATFSGNVSIAGTLTYEDVTNVDSIGLITARSGVRIDSGGLNVTGLSTFNNDIYVNQIRRRTDNSTNTKIQLNAGQIKLFAGNGTTPKLSLNGTVAITTNATVSGVLTANSFSGDGSTLSGVVTSIVAGGNINVTSSSGIVTISANTTQMVSDTLETTTLNVTGVTTLGGDINVNGDIVTDVNVSGVVSATSFAGDGSTLSGVVTSITAGDNISIDGSTGNVTITGIAATSNINADTLVVTGVSTLGTVTATTYFGDGSNLTGVVPTGSSTRSVNRYVAIESQTEFPPIGSVNYSVGFIDVYLNGGKLDSTEFTATNGTNIVLTTAASVGDIIELVALHHVSFTDVNVVNDTTPQLGGDLDVNGFDITGTGDINLTGVISATSFNGSLATSDLTGTITNDQLAGSINNSKLDNSSISFGGVTLDLGQADPTPAFDLSDAFNYPFTSLSGITTEIVGDTTPQLGGNLDVNGNDITGTGDINLTGVVTATSFVGDGSGLTGIANTANINADAIVVSGVVTATLFEGDGSGLTNVGVDTANVSTDSLVVIGVSTLGVVTGATYYGDGSNLTGITVDSSTTRTVNRYVATENQTLFPPTGTVSYEVGYVDVFLNGSKLDSTEFTATNGTTVTLTTGASVNDVLELVAFTKIGITTVNLVEDTSPQLGGDLDVNGFDITGTGDVNLTGVITATSFSGSGTNLTGIVTSITAGDNISIDNSTGNVTITGLANTANVSADTVNTGSLNVTGVTTLAGNTNISGDITSNVTIVSTDTGSSAAPEFTLYRNSASPAPGDYLGQIMFKGENSNGGEENYAKITGKISDETLGTEDGLIETAIKGDGSFTIVSRQRSDQLQLINGVGLSVDGDSTFTGGIDVDGHTELDNVNVSGAITATTFTGALDGNAGTATSLENARNFSVTGDFVTAPTVSFDGTSAVALAATITADSITLGTYTSGDYVESVSGTANEIQVTSGTGEGSTPTIGLVANPTIGGNVTIGQDLTVTRDLKVTRNLNVDGTVTIGGTSATIFAETLKISDPDLVLGFRTDANGNDISNDSTASHGGVALASTEGSPLINLVGAGETLAPTYKKIMWFKTNSFTGLNTDAWLSNYAFGVGTTSMSSGTKFAVGNIEADFDDFTSVRNINSSGIITASSLFVGSSNEFEIGFKSGNTEITNNTGDLLILGSGGSNTIKILPDASNNSITANSGGSVELFFNNVKKLETVNTGVDITGSLDVSSQAIINSSVNIADKIIHIGDTDTSIRFPSNDTFTIETAGSERLRVDSNGRIGINTNSPGLFALDVRGTGQVARFGDPVISNDALWIDITNDGYPALRNPSSTETLALRSSGGVEVSIDATNNNTDKVFTVVSNGHSGSGTELLRINESGETTINASSTSALFIKDNNVDSSGLKLYSDSAGLSHINAGYGNLVLETSGTERVRIDSNGNFGVGTNNPASKLTIKDETGGQSLLIEGSGGNDVVVLGSVNGATNRGELILKEGTSGAERVKFTSEASTPSFILGNDFGIGVTNPSEKLEVAGNLILDQSNSQIKLKSGGTGTTGAINFTFNTDSTVYAGLDLEYNTRASVGLRLFSGYPLTLESQTNSHIAFRRGTTETARIDSSGNLGIGTDNPQYKLQVEGDIKLAATGTIWFDDNSGTIEKIKASASSIDIYADSEVRFFESDASTEKVSIDVNNARIFFQDDSDTYWYRPAANQHAWTTSGTERFKIFSDGPVLFTPDALGTTAGNTRDLATFQLSNGNTSILKILEERDTTGTNWTNSFTRIQKIIDSTEMGYIQFNGSDLNYGIEFGTNADEKFAVFKRNNSVDLYYDNVKKFETTPSGITVTGGILASAASEFTAPLTIDSDNNAAGALRIENNVTDTNNDFYFALEIAQTLSGSQVATGDREQGGIYMDINSTNTGGGISDEHRVYGIYIDLDATGDADAVTGIYANATATPGTGTVSNVWAGYFFGEDNGGSGQVSSVFGIQSFAYSDNSNSDTNNQYAGYFKAYCAADSAAVGAARGVYSEIEINGTTDLYGNCYVFQAEVDNNTNVAQTNTTYLFYGNYAGTLPTTAYGIYINDNVESYFAGPIVSAQNITAFSDINLKKNIEVIPDALDKVSQIRGVTFDRIDMEDEPRQSGVIAQEVEKVLPEVVRTAQDGTKTVAYGNLVGLLIESIKELKAEVEALKKENN